MLPIELSRHPISIIPRLKERFGDGIRLEFGRYVYLPQSLVDKRVTVRTDIAEVGPNWLNRELERLSSDEELALHSTVTLKGKAFHLPMIDFHGSSRAAISAVSAVLPSEFAQNFLVFASGRSFHGYCIGLLAPEEWVQFMGTLLLANLPGEAAVVDQRWVGHRLRAGYSALRWSCNTAAYEQFPTLIYSGQT